MDIIKPGKPGTGGWSAEVMCTGKGNGNNGCGALLKVYPKDLYYTHSWARDECTSYTTFRCVSCGAQTDIPEPPGVKVREKEGRALA